MNSASLLPLATFLLVAFSVGGMLFAALYARLTGRAQLDGRLALALGQALPAPSVSRQRSRKRSVEETLRELEEQQKAQAGRRGRPSLIIRLRQAGLSWSRATYFGLCCASAIASFMLGFVATGLGTLPALGFAVAGGLLVPHLYVSQRRTRRFRRFSAEFPQAVDVVVRGVKAGLPLVDCLKIVAAECAEPVRGEFRVIVEDQTLGVPTDESVERMAERIPLPEASFFAIVIAIQSRTGGSLSEALGNLSKVLRDRKKMASKIKAMSAEAKASAVIIGVLPIGVGVLVSITSPDYISLLFTTAVGNVVLAVSAAWMVLGTLIMRKMINFDF